MTETAVEDLRGPAVATGATGRLRELNVAGVLVAADVHVAQRLAALAGDEDERVAVATALVVRALRQGSVCLDLTTVATDLPDQAWPSPTEWTAALIASPLTGTPPVLRVEGTRVYLDRYWREEDQVCRDLLERGEATGDRAPASLDQLFPDVTSLQREAALTALGHRTSVLTGGPGTGKTTTVARILALLAEQAGDTRLRIALAAPTGKAAARLQQAVLGQVAGLAPVHQQRLAGLQAMTLHRLLGSRMGTSSRFRHHRDNRLPHDVVVVDETSMVSLTMMARLLEALRPECRLILVGDPDQLASVEAGAVLADVVDGLARRDRGAITQLEKSFRFGNEIGALADAVRHSAADQVVELLRAGGEHVSWLETDDPGLALRPTLLAPALRVRRHAEAGDAAAALEALSSHRLLCAHREGAHGVRHWNRLVERWLGEETGEGIWSAWYAGRPLLVTANDYGLGLYNGDVGVAVQGPAGLRAAVEATSGRLDLATSRLGDVETMHAMTVHKSQGSQAAEVTVLLPPEDSPLLVRELFYTAVTRAEQHVRVVGTEAAVRRAVEHRAQRASGLADRLSGG